MVINRKVTGRASSIPAGLAIGACSSMGITVLLSVLAAGLVSGERIQEGSIGYLAMFILLVASAAGALVAGNKIKKMRLQVAALSAVIYFCLLLGVTALFFGGQYEGMGVTLVMVLLGSGAGGMATVFAGGSGKRYKHKKVRC